MPDTTVEVNALSNFYPSSHNFSDLLFSLLLCKRKLISTSSEIVLPFSQEKRISGLSFA